MLAKLALSAEEQQRVSNWVERVLPPHLDVADAVESSLERGQVRHVRIQGEMIPALVLLDLLCHSKRFRFFPVDAASSVEVAPPGFDFSDSPESLSDFGELLLLQQLLVDVLRLARQNCPNGLVLPFLARMSLELSLVAFDFGDMTMGWPRLVFEHRLDAVLQELLMPLKLVEYHSPPT